MKLLTLFRHAKSSWDQADLPDHDRPLSRRGHHDAPVMGQRLTEMGIRPSLIVSSSAVRAWATAREVARAISYPVEFLHREPRLYHAGVNSLFDVIATQEERFNSILLVGHNPGLTDLANELVPGVTGNIPTAGFVAVEIDAETWDLRASSGIRLLAFDFPKRAQAWRNY